MQHRTGLLQREVSHFSIWRMLIFLSCFLNCVAWAQTAEKTPADPSSDPVSSSVRDLQEQVRQLREAVTEIRSEAAQYRMETAALREELRATQKRLDATGNLASNSPAATHSKEASAVNEGTGPETTSPTVLEDRISKVEEETQLLNGKVDEQHQTKIESASKYRVRLSGIVLFNLFSNRGDVDNQDFPTLALGGSQRSFGATLRQSELGLEIFGPQLAGARTRGDVQLDFSGGFPQNVNGVTAGLVRLRTATLHLDWLHTSIVAGQDNIFFSPLSPTTFASLSVPAFAYMGDLWGWIPQLRVEHRFDFGDDSNVILQAGILDNLVGEPPFLQAQRIPQAGERTGQPAYAFRTAIHRRVFGQSMTLGAGGYFSPQDWSFGQHVNGWAGTADWDVLLSHGFSFSGEFYRGLAAGGLGAGIGRSVIFSGPPYTFGTLVRGLDSIGGWSQIKFRPALKLEFNAAFGMDNVADDDLLAFSASQAYFDPKLSKNRGTLLNFIYRPRSNLLFSAEYRHLSTFDIYTATKTADHVNLMMGVLF